MKESNEKVLVVCERALAKSSCSRCGGLVGVDRDVYGWYEYCISCGYAKDLVLEAK